MKKKNKDLSEFSKTLDQLGFSDSDVDNNSVSDVDKIDNSVVIDIDDIDDDKIDSEPDGNSEDDEKNKGGQEGSVHDDDSDIPDNILNNQTTTKDDDSDDNDEPLETDELDESVHVGAFFDAFAEANGWAVEEDEKPKDINGLVDYMKQLVEENSKPEYSDPRIAQLDEYVRNGGDFVDFYNNVSQTVSYDKLDMEDESNQKTVIKDFLKYQGYSDEQISNKIERYEDADMLEDEANDAVERLKQIKQQQIEQQRELQEQQYVEQQERVKQFATDLNNTVSNLTTIRGIAIPKEDRKKLLDYITKVDENGLTQYQKDFNNNQVQNLIESAYFTMKGDALIGSAKNSGQTTAVDKLRRILKNSSKNHSSYGINDDNKRSVADIASMFYK